MTPQGADRLRAAVRPTDVLAALRDPRLGSDTRHPGSVLGLAWLLHRTVVKPAARRPGGRRRYGLGTHSVPGPSGPTPASSPGAGEPPATPDGAS
ncbi:hypothetical protein ACGFRB_21815 [Streptomyces sp. NPDC048718]|uniref:hypothetical protein n=1 Tax=Streptomyces sp. NPDC048718 TaxID=3365587 RepID=UPI00371360F5